MLAVLGEVLAKAAGPVAEIDRDLDLAESAATVTADLVLDRGLSRAGGFPVASAGSGLKLDCNLAGSDIGARCQPDFLLRARCPHHKQFHRLWNRHLACSRRGSMVFPVQGCSRSNRGVDLSLLQFHPA